MHYKYRPVGVCPFNLEFDIDDSSKVTNIHFDGGCNGNLKAVSKLCDGMTLYSRNGSGKRLEMGAFGLGMKKDGAIVPDDFRHEHYLLIEEAGKRILISGCSHKGIINIAENLVIQFKAFSHHCLKMRHRRFFSVQAFDFFCHFFYSIIFI